MSGCVGQHEVESFIKLKGSVISFKLIIVLLIYNYQGYLIHYLFIWKCHKMLGGILLSSDITRIYKHLNSFLLNNESIA